MERFSFRQLRVYQAAMLMVLEVGRLAREIPRDHLDLVWQMRRAARSVVLNIAEGAGEYALKEKARYYRIARRSAFETIAALDMAVQEGFIASASLHSVLERLDAIIGMLTTMSKNAEQKRESERRRSRQGNTE